MPRGVYERKKKTAGTAVEKVKKVYRTKTKATEKLASPVSAGSAGSSIPQAIQDLNQLMAYLHTLVVSKTQGVRSAVLDGEINDVIVLLKGLRETIYGKIGATAPAAVTAGAVIQEVAPEVPQQAVFTPPA